MVNLIATLEAKPGKEQALEALLKGVIPKVAKEEGVIAYTLHKASDNPNVFMFYEKYKDQAGLDHHMSAPYVQELFAKFDGLIAGEPQIVFYTEIGSIRK